MEERAVGIGIGVWSSGQSRRALNAEVAGSNPAIPIRNTGVSSSSVQDSRLQNEKRRFKSGCTHYGRVAQSGQRRRLLTSWSPVQIRARPFGEAI